MKPLLILGRVASIATAVALASCAATPQVNVGYYEARSSVAITVTQTVACSPEKIPILVNGVEWGSSYRRSTSEWQDLDLDALKSVFGKSEFGIEFYGDGRLRSINTKGIGQAGDVAKAAIKLAATAAALSGSNVSREAACSTIKDLVGEGKPLSIVYRGYSEFDENDNIVNLQQATVSPEEFNRLKAAFGTVTVSFVLEQPAKTLGSDTPDGKGALLNLREPAIAVVTVDIARDSQSTTFVQRVSVPQRGKPYSLRIPKAPPFGSNEFEIALGEDGRVTKLKYNSSGDTTSAIGVLSDTSSALQGESTVQEAARLKSEADVIYEQQRLAQCLADRTKCSK